MDKHRIFLTSPIEPEHVESIRAAATDAVEVIYEPDLLPPVRYIADHKGDPAFRRDAGQETRWREHLARATILWDFPGGPVGNGGALSLAPHVRWVQTTSSGVGQMVRDFGLADSDLIVTTARGVHARPLAEFAVMALLLQAKRYPFLKSEQAGHRWERYCGISLAGQTLLVVGAGKVGAEVGRFAKAFGMTVLALVRRPSQDRRTELHADEVHGLGELERLVARADAVVLAAPHTPATDGMISRAVIARMKPGVVFVNIGRGQLVDEEALIEALRSGAIGLAALDVARVEPLPDGSPLWDLPNVLVSPHSASTVAGENAAITDIFCRNIPLFLAGRTSEMTNILDKAQMY
ncbi:D-2-hydroxyacid dehydrogenase [Bosea sp. BK604]|uniref:D-2-hydroxyacid dehydrogenase n=1 Tax=Bosea sp. BK604 TaxID=2512180 RepID=UPI0010D65B24|nr:D-2-hydroxyacid dehydrogenase [Bosea sp. BK604]TCR65335.1 phosphoglycerate dehydrogenase-like enzyme [Bosea sp. BK604]